MPEEADAVPCREGHDMSADQTTRTLSFWGASDDLFECDDSVGRATEEIGCYDAPGIYRITRGDEGLFVTGHYAPGNVVGCWSVGVMQLDEDKPLPDWPITISAKGYSAVVTVAVPADAECAPHGK